MLMSLVREANFVYGHYDIVIYKDYLAGEYLIQIYDVRSDKIVFEKTTPVLPPFEEILAIIKQLEHVRRVYMN